jgi:hypothetical protein
VWWFKVFYSGCVVVLGVDLVFGLINCVLKKEKKKRIIIKNGHLKGLEKE